MSKKRTVKSHEVELTDLEFWKTNKTESQIYSIDILTSDKVMDALKFIRDKMKIPFGLGLNDTFYLISEGDRPEIRHYYNFPLNITYNDYSRDIQVTEFFPESKLRELNELTRTHLSQLDWVDSEEELEEEYETLPAFLDSNRSYLELRSWVFDEENEVSDYYDDLAHLYLTVTQQFNLKHYNY